jgi:hypothetical protein
LPAKVGESRPGADKRLLREIERLVFILEDSQGEVINIALMLIHQRSKGILIAFLSTPDERGFVVHAGFLQRVRQGKTGKVSGQTIDHGRWPFVYCTRVKLFLKSAVKRSENKENST